MINPPTIACQVLKAPPVEMLWSIFFADVDGPWMGRLQIRLPESKATPISCVVGLCFHGAPPLWLAAVMCARQSLSDVLQEKWNILHASCCAAPQGEQLTTMHSRSSV